MTTHMNGLLQKNCNVRFLLTQQSDKKTRKMYKLFIVSSLHPGCNQWSKKIFNLYLEVVEYNTKF